MERRATDIQASDDPMYEERSIHSRVISPWRRGGRLFHLPFEWASDRYRFPFTIHSPGFETPGISPRSRVALRVSTTMGVWIRTFL